MKELDDISKKVLTYLRRTAHQFRIRDDQRRARPHRQQYPHLRVNQS